MIKKIKRYIPDLVYKKIQELNFKNKEHLYIICDMIYRISIYRKEDTDYKNNFIDIPKTYFRDIIVDSESLLKSFSILKESKILLCDNVYSKNNGKALGYKFSDELISKLIVVEIEKPTITKRIINNRNERNNYVNEKLTKYKNYFLSNFKIDYTNAIKYLDGWYEESINNLPTYTLPYVGGNLENYIKIINKYNSIFISLSAIDDGDLFFKKNNTNGRIDTNLTNLKSEYKKFIVSNKDLYQIDIINSQPFILYLYLNSPLCRRKLDDKDKKELNKYGDWTSSGLFYELFEKEYLRKTGKVLTRKEIKNMMFCIFYSKNGTYQKEKNIFKTIFPFINKMIESEKSVKHNDFAIKLQKIESKICIDKICSVLDIEDIEYYTIHDAWLVDKKDIDKTIKIIYNEFYENFHRRPELKIEKIK